MNKTESPVVTARKPELSIQLGKLDEKQRVIFVCAEK
jgi:hypothetical protein